MRQALQARLNSSLEFNSHLKYTPFLDNTWEKPKEANLESLTKELKAIVEHHWNAIPQYKRSESVNLENIAWFAHSIACLYADTTQLARETMGLEFLENKEASQEFWNTLFKVIKDVFQDYSVLFTAYVEWKNSSEASKTTEKTDWTIRPPCGILYRTEFKALFDEIRRNKFGKKPFGKDSHKKDARNDKDKKSKEGSEHKPKSYPKRERAPVRESNEFELNAAKAECTKALETIKKNSKIPEIPLSAQNSFIRREQHTLINEAGFQSESRGEADKKHVCIVRAKL